MIKNVEQHRERRQATKAFNKEHAIRPDNEYPPQKIVSNATNNPSRVENEDRQILSALLETASKLAKSKPLFNDLNTPEATVHMIHLEIFTMIRHAYLRMDVVEHIISKYNLSREDAEFHYSECLTALANQVDEYALDVLRNNTAVLLTILNDSMVKNDGKNSLRCIEELNKMYQVYDMKNTVNVKTEDVTISFG